MFSGKAHLLPASQLQAATYVCVHLYLSIYPCHSLAVVLCVLLLAPPAASHLRGAYIIYQTRQLVHLLNVQWVSDGQPSGRLVHNSWIPFLCAVEPLCSGSCFLRSVTHWTVFQHVLPVPTCNVNVKENLDWQTFNCFCRAMITPLPPSFTHLS